MLILPTLLVTMDLNVLLLALPRISEDLQAGPIAQLWITDIYAFIVAGLTVTMGHVGDRFGRRKVLLISASVFVVASLVCAFSTSVPMLVVSRGVLGASGAAIAPLTLAIIVATFKNPKQMGFALGIWASALAGGVVLGPPVGGILLHSFWWGSVFLIAIPIMAVVLLAGPFVLKESRNPDGGSIDVRSVLLFLVAILPLVGALKETARSGFGLQPAALLVLGVVGIVLFVRRQSRIPNPLIDLTLFRDKMVRSGMSVFVTGGLWSGALSLVIALYLQLVEGLSVLVAGLVMLPAAFIGMVCNMIAPKFANVFRPARVVAVGLLIAMVGALTLTLVAPLGGVVIVVVGMTLVMIGSSPIGPVTNHVVMSNIPPAKAGAVGGMIATGGELGVAIGVAAMGSVANAVYQGNVTVPAGVPADAATSAGDGITGAVAVARTLPQAQGTALLDSAHDAFNAGLVTVAVIAAIGYTLVATVAWRGMGHVLPFGAGQEAPANDGTGGEPDPDAERAAA
ncbi:MFS transporter [Amycolatopsis sp. NBC_01488]|uniref:MFS transporter n=1 Tax=Amycolatopsis sp. NBC_01488 TaxID=2903563 RepID=UPI002E2CE4E3|nr:MFS transporter [Amycolatopsis sp. NBC_01488]